MCIRDREKTNEAYALAKISGLKYCEFLNRQYGLSLIHIYDGFGGLLFFYSGILLNINDIDIYRKIKVLANRINLYIAAYMICSILLVRLTSLFGMGRAGTSVL